MLPCTSAWYKQSLLDSGLVGLTLLSWMLIAGISHYMHYASIRIIWSLWVWYPFCFWDRRIHLQTISAWWDPRSPHPGIGPSNSLSPYSKYRIFNQIARRIGRYASSLRYPAPSGRTTCLRPQCLLAPSRCQLSLWTFRWRRRNGLFPSCCKCNPSTIHLITPKPFGIKYRHHLGRCLARFGLSIYRM